MKEPWKIAELVEHVRKRAIFVEYSPFPNIEHFKPLFKYARSSFSFYYKLRVLFIQRTTLWGET